MIVFTMKKNQIFQVIQKIAYYYNIQQKQLCREMKKSSRPQELTHYFIASLTQGIGQKEGVFQILEFHKKKGRYFSVHISDGYFKVKVIFIQQAAKQIDKQNVKLFSILRGKIKNNGEKVLLAKKQFEVWDFHMAVGITKQWNFSKANLNDHGFCEIKWSVDVTEEQKRESIDSSDFLDELQNLEKKDPAHLAEVDSLIKQASQHTNTMNSLHFSPPRLQNNKRKLLISNSSQKSLEPIKKTYHETANSKVSRRSSKQRSSSFHQDDSSGSLLDYLFQERKKMTKVQEAYCMDYDSDKSLEEIISSVVSNSHSLPRKKQPKILFSNDTEIKFSQLLQHHKYRNDDWMCMKVLAIKEIFQSKQICILIRTKQNNITNIYIKNIGQNLEIKCNEVYKLKLRNVSVSELKGLGFSFSVEGSRFQYEQDFTSFQPTDGSYKKLPEISELSDGAMVHIFGVVKSFFCNRSKKNEKTWIHRYSVIDVKIGTTVQMVFFEELRGEDRTGEPIVAYNLRVNSFRGKKTLNSSRESLLFIGRQKIEQIGEWVPSLESATSWLQEGNDVHDLVEDIEKYTYVRSVHEVLQLRGNQLVCIQSCTLLSFAEKCGFDACDKCHKKVVGTFCKNCACKITPQHRLFMIASVGDNSGILTVIWNDTECRRLIGQEAEYIDSFKQQYNLTTIKIWLQNDGKSQLYSVTGIKKIKIQETFSDKLLELQTKLQYK